MQMALENSTWSHVYRTDRFPGLKNGTAVAVKKGIPHDHMNLLPLVSIEATEICIATGRSEVLLAEDLNLKYHRHENLKALAMTPLAHHVMFFPLSFKEQQGMQTPFLCSVADYAYLLQER
jgi:hypothetical protein